MIIPDKDEELINIYRCPKCKGIFQKQSGTMQLRCGVLHSPGSCCHYAEIVLDDGVVQKIKEVIEKANENKNK